MKSLMNDNVTRAGAALALCVAIALFASASVPVAAANHASDDEPMMRTISVSGLGQVKGTPDQALLSAGVVAHGRTAAEALANNSRSMNQVFATLKRLGIPEKNVQTSNFNLSPQYDPNDDKAPRRIVGYEVNNTVTVTVQGIANAGPAIDALVGAGANESQGIFFTIADPKPLEAKARREAVAEAMTKARTLADASGVRLGRIISIADGGGYSPPMPMMHRMAMAQDASTPVAAGEATVMVNVSVVYEIL